VLARLGHEDIAVTREVGSLPSAGRQIVSMARALSHDARLIVMDEPSAVLAHNEVETLFRTICDLTRQGVAVVYISHRLEEIRAIGDRLTVLEDGRTVGNGLPARATPTADVVALMTGRTIEYAFPPRPARRAYDELLRVEHLSLGRSVKDVSFTVGRGEIVGIAGLVGAGRSELLETVYGARRRTPELSPSKGARCLPATSTPPYGAVSGWHLRSARGRRCCSRNRCRATSHCRRCRATPGWAG
jgi:ribose transport system ATP-binding protein